MVAVWMALALVVSFATACDSTPKPAPPPVVTPAPEAKPGGRCAYEDRTGQCRLVSHETVSAGDGVYENVIVRGTYEWAAEPPGVTGAVEWRLTRDRAAAAEAYLAGHADAPCAATVLVSGSCPPQSSRVSRIDVSPP